MKNLLVIAGLTAALSLASPASADIPLSSVLTHTCTPIGAAIYTGVRYHVRCDVAGIGTIWSDQTVSFFSIGVTDPHQVAQVMELVDTAVLAGKRITITYPLSEADNPPGCDPANCRKIIALTLRAQ